MNKILYLSTLLVTIIFYGCATSGPGINNIKAELPNSPITSEIKEDQILEEDSTVAQIDEEISEKNNQSESEITDDMISPLIEKKETIVATGYAVVSVQNHDTASQQRLLAIRASKSFCLSIIQVLASLVVLVQDFLVLLVLMLLLVAAASFAVSVLLFPSHHEQVTYRLQVV